MKTIDFDKRMIYEMINPRILGYPTWHGSVSVTYCSDNVRYYKFGMWGTDDDIHQWTVVKCHE